MARKKNAVPSYLLHRASGQARVRIDGHDYLLGPYLSDESRVRYGEIIARHNAGLPPVENGKQAAAVEDPGPSVAEVIVAFREHAKKHYVKNGIPTSEFMCFDACFRLVRELYGLTPAKEFGPLALRAVREKMIEGDPDAKDAEGNPAPRKPWARSNINRMVSRVRHAFKFAVSLEMIDVSVLHRLQTLPPLGRNGGARETKKRHAVQQCNIDAISPHVSQLVKDLIQLQLRTGSRSGELLMLSTEMIDRTGQTWHTVLPDHKLFHLDLERTLYFGPKAREILSKYLDDENPNQRLFKINRTSYCRAITRACAEAGIQRWTPHWLRHTYISRTREVHGLDAAQAVAGHSSSEMTEEYSKEMANLARKTAESIG